jgi:hypothetical protein
MDQLSIQTIEGFLGVPLVAPERIHEIDAKEIAAALGRLEEEAAEAREDLEDAWDQPEVQDETNRERLAEVTELIQDAIKLCATCQAGQVCQGHEALKLWAAEA